MKQYEKVLAARFAQRTKHKLTKSGTYIKNGRKPDPILATLSDLQMKTYRKLRSFKIPREEALRVAQQSN